MSQPEVASPSPKVYIVDDEAEVRSSLARLFCEHGFAAQVYSSGEEFLQAVGPHDRGCLVVDVVMPGISGVETLRQILERGDHRPTIVLSGYAETLDIVQAMKLGAVDFFDKPVRPEVLLDCVKRCTDSIRIAAARNADIKALEESLSAEERLILTGIAHGLTDQAMADEQDISLRTLQLRKRKLKSKLHVETRSELLEKLRVIGWKADESS